MPSFNKVILVGNLTADPELKQTPSGATTTTFRIAVNRKYSKEGNTSTDFFSIVAWKSTAEFVCKYFKKGSAILVSGPLQTRTWKDKDGGNRYATEVIADEVMFVDGKGENEAQKEPASFSAYPKEAPNFETIGNDENLPF